MLLGSITMTISVRSENYETPHNTISSRLLLLPFSFQTLSVYAFPLRKEDRVSHPK
jgi:hypothetical protein